MTAAKPEYHRWISVEEACRAIRGNRVQVRNWLYSRGLVRRAPWGAVGVDIDEAMRRLAIEAEVVARPAGGLIAALAPPPLDTPASLEAPKQLPGAHVATLAAGRRGRPPKAKPAVRRFELP